jgi:putative endonuclease
MKLTINLPIIVSDETIDIIETLITTCHMKLFTSKTQRIGELGEDIACNYIKKRGYKVVERNYTKKQGEIDVIAQKDKTLYFIEVKAVTCKDIVTCETIIQPYENLTINKLDKFKRIVSAYLVEKRVSPETEFDLLLASVWIDKVNKKTKVELQEIR